MLKLDGVHKKFKSALVAEQISVDLGPCTYGLLVATAAAKPPCALHYPGGKGKRRAALFTRTGTAGR